MDGFQQQKDWYSCGAHAFMHSMLLFGKTMSIKESKSRCKTISYWDSIKKEFRNINIIASPAKESLEKLKNITSSAGTDEHSSIRAIRKMKFKPVVSWLNKEVEAKKFILKNLSKGIPLITLFNTDGEVDDSGHWIVICGVTGKYFIVIDSAPYDCEVIDFYTWEELTERFCWFDEDDTEYFEFYGIGVCPNDASLLEHSMVHTIDKIVPLFHKDEELMTNWGYYTDDLLSVFSFEDKGVAVYDVLNKYSKDIIGSVDYWDSYSDKKSLMYLMDVYKQVAMAYNIKIPEKEVVSKMIDFTVAFNNELAYY
jgi:hypothetical protein